MDDRHHGRRYEDEDDMRHMPSTASVRPVKNICNIISLAALRAAAPHSLDETIRKNMNWKEFQSQAKQEDEKNRSSSNNNSSSSSSSSKPRLQINSYDDGPDHSPLRASSPTSQKEDSPPTPNHHADNRGHYLDEAGFRSPSVVSFSSSSSGGSMGTRSARSSPKKTPQPPPGTRSAKSSPPGKTQHHYHHHHRSGDSGGSGSHHRPRETVIERETYHEETKKTEKERIIITNHTSERHHHSSSGWHRDRSGEEHHRDRKHREEKSPVPESKSSRRHEDLGTPDPRSRERSNGTSSSSSRRSDSSTEKKQSSSSSSSQSSRWERETKNPEFTLHRTQNLSTTRPNLNLQMTSSKLQQTGAGLQLELGTTIDIPVEQSFKISQTGTFHINDFQIRHDGVLSPTHITHHRGGRSGNTPQSSTRELESSEISHASYSTPSASSRSLHGQGEDDVETPRRPEDGWYALSARDLVALGTIGRGQNGSVVKSLHLPSLTRLALKKINVYNQDTRHQLLRELKCYSVLDSPYVVSFLGAFFDSNAGGILLASEYMDCGSLESLVKRKGPLPEVALRHITRQVVRGLGYLHREYYVHRDIKPDNILINHKGECKIADFGLVKQLQHTMDQTQSFMGTMSYLAPERILAKSYSYPSDTWAVGMTLIFCALGHLPFPTDDYFVLVEHITKRDPPNLSQKDGFSANLISFLDACLRVNPAERLTCDELLRHPWLNGSSNLSSSGTPSPSGQLLTQWLETNLRADISDIPKMADFIIEHRNLDPGADLTIIHQDPIIMGPPSSTLSTSPLSPLTPLSPSSITVATTTTTTTTTPHPILSPKVTTTTTTTTTTTVPPPLLLSPSLSISTTQSFSSLSSFTPSSQQSSQLTPVVVPTLDLSQSFSLSRPDLSLSISGDSESNNKQNRSKKLPKPPQLTSTTSPTTSEDGDNPTFLQPLEIVSSSPDTGKSQISNTSEPGIPEIQIEGDGEINTGPEGGTGPRLRMIPEGASMDDSNRSIIAELGNPEGTSSSTGPKLLLDDLVPEIEIFDEDENFSYELPTQITTEPMSPGSITTTNTTTISPSISMIDEGPIITPPHPPRIEIPEPTISYSISDRLSLIIETVAQNFGATFLEVQDMFVMKLSQKFGLNLPSNARPIPRSPLTLEIGPETPTTPPPPSHHHLNSTSSSSSASSTSPIDKTPIKNPSATPEMKSRSIKTPHNSSTNSSTKMESGGGGGSSSTSHHTTSPSKVNVNVNLSVSLNAVVRVNLGTGSDGSTISTTAELLTDSISSTATPSRSQTQRSSNGNSGGGNHLRPSNSNSSMSSSSSSGQQYGSSISPSPSLGGGGSFPHSLEQSSDLYRRSISSIGSSLPGSLGGGSLESAGSLRRETTGSSPEGESQLFEME